MSDVSLVRLTYFVEVLSSWCHWAEPSWAEWKTRFADDVEFEWKIALMPPSAFPPSREECLRYYQRSGTVMKSPYRLHPGWLEPELAGDYTAPNLVVEACRELGGADDRVRLALAHAALREGQMIGRLEVAARLAAEVLEVDPATIREAALAPAVRARVDASTAEFHAHRIDQRPAFLLESVIGDKAVFSGLVRPEPIAATIEAMLADARGYASYAAQFGEP